jgi:RNA polymerase sigma-70 factor (ECF subfamily)
MLAKHSSAPTSAVTVPTFESVYADNLSRVVRMVRRMGVRPSALEDVVQDVFLVVHQKLWRFEARASISTWLSAIVVRVVHNHRRTLRRKGAGQALASVVDDADSLVAPASDSPHEQLQRREASRIWRHALELMGRAKADVFVMVELEGRSVVESACLLGVPPNTAYSRLRAARRDFSKLVASLC